MKNLNLWVIGQVLIRLGVALKDADAICSGNVHRMKRRFINRAIGEIIYRGTSKLYLKGKGKR